jgi:hypothetical protein
MKVEAAMFVRLRRLAPVLDDMLKRFAPSRLA